ncbi:Microcystin LR degradation protein MlrC [Hyaloscypha variabilis]
MGGGEVPPRRPLIAIAGLACETSTFSPSKTLAPAFHPKRGSEIIQKYPFLHPGTPLGHSAEWKGALIGHALPGGIVTRDAFEELAGEIVSRLEEIVATSAALDGLWFDIHGAMCVEGLDDVEAELLRRVRGVIGKEVIVSASMDLHGNVSRELCHQTDLITCYRMAPHEDTMETKERACQNLMDLLMERPRRRPMKAWVPVPILLPGEQTSTRVEPAKHIYAAVPKVKRMKGVIDAAIWVGYAWADEPRNRGAVVVTGWDEMAVVEGAEKLAKLFWDAHKDFVFVAPHGSFKECLDTALASKSRPYFISDSGDNPTAGGSGDMTWGLTKLLARPEFKDPSGPTVIYASVPGSKAVHTAVEAGVGAIITVTAGAEVDNIHAGPLTMTGRVHSIKHGDKDAVIEVVLQIGSVFAILTELRKPYHHEQDFTDLNLSPRSADIVIVKIGYLEPELYDMAKDWMLALTPGGVDQDLERLGHHRIRRPMWPFDKKFEKQPDLSARLISMSNDPLTGPDE